MAANKNCWLKLEHLSFIRATGADVVSFLQGQLSNDVRQLSPAQAQISSYNSPKGRMLAVLHLHTLGDDVILEIHRGVCDSVLKRLRLYVLRSKVNLSQSGSALGLIGADTPALLENLGLPCPARALEMRNHEGVSIIRRLGTVPRFSLYAATEVLSAVAERFTAVLAQGSEQDWKRADIEAGVPVIYPATQDHFVPQWCNLDQLGGISFDKGCYTGQEIVARIHYLGEVKRRMKIIDLGACETLEPGGSIEAGELVDWVTRPEGGCIGLVVQKTSPPA